MLKVSRTDQPLIRLQRRSPGRPLLPVHSPLMLSFSDGNGGTDSETITVTVTAANVAPVLGAIGAKSIIAGQQLTFTATATDANIPAQTLTFSLANGVSGSVPAGASITPAGDFTWTPTTAGSFTFDVVVSDGNGGTDSETITVTVTAANVAPVLGAIGAKSIIAGQQAYLHSNGNRCKYTSFSH